MTQRHLPRLPRLRAPHYLAYSSPLRPRWILEKYQRHTNHHRRNIQNITIAPHWRESQQINNTQGEGVEPLEPGWHMDFIIVHFNFLLLRFNSLSQQTTHKVEELGPSNLAGTWTSRGCEQWPGPKVAHIIIIIIMMIMTIMMIMMIISIITITSSCAF